MKEMSYYKIRLMAYKDGSSAGTPVFRASAEKALPTMKWWWRNRTRAAPILRTPFICPIIRW